MRITSTITQSLLAICTVGAVASAGPPLLDRPSPPPCCADGLCYPNPTTFGWYATRWRRWPTETLEPIPAGAMPPAGLKDIEPYSPPGKEEEDRRAPAPTRKPEAAAEAEATSPAGAPAAETPSTTPLAPPTTPVAPPGGGVTEPPGKMPWENGAPTGDWDPPPAPPFGRPSIVEAPAIRAAGRPVSAPAHRRAVRARPAASHDPPPPFPLAMSNGAY